jgi:hypothetical protein
VSTAAVDTPHTTHEKRPIIPSIGVSSNAGLVTPYRGPAGAKVLALACRTTVQGVPPARFAVRQTKHEGMHDVSQKDPLPGEARQRLPRSAAYS